MILLTDGANTSGKMTPEQATAIAKEHGVTIYTVGVGAEIIQHGRRALNPSRDLDENTLRAIADGTGGRYFRARDAQSLAEVYAAIDALEPVASDETFYRPVEDVFYYPLATAWLLALGLFLLQLWQNRLYQPSTEGKPS